MRLIRQKTEIDCGLATAAMLTGRSYGDAFKHDPNPYADHGLSVTEFVTLAKALSGKGVSVSKAGYLLPLEEAYIEGVIGYDEPVALVIRPMDGRHHGHWIAMHKGNVFDPERKEKMGIGRYDLRTKWRLIRTVRLT